MPRRPMTYTALPKADRATFYRAQIRRLQAEVRRLKAQEGAARLKVDRRRYKALWVVARRKLVFFQGRLRGMEE